MNPALSRNVALGGARTVNEPGRAKPCSRAQTAQELARRLRVCGQGLPQQPGIDAQTGTEAGSVLGLDGPGQRQAGQARAVGTDRAADLPVAAPDSPTSAGDNSTGETFPAPQGWLGVGELHFERVLRCRVLAWAVGTTRRKASGAGLPAASVLDVRAVAQIVATPETAGTAGPVLRCATPQRAGSISSAGNELAGRLCTGRLTPNLA